MRRTVWLAALGLIVAVGAVVSAQPRGTIRLVQQPPSTLRFSAPWRPGSVGGQTQIIGTVIDIRQVPVAKVTVTLRNLNTGQVIGEVETNENGEYLFDAMEPGTYVVEMVLADGYVIALSNAGSLARYETLQTVIQLSGRWDVAARNMVAVRSFGNFVGVSSETTLTATTLTMAVIQNITPVDAGEPVSP